MYKLTKLKAVENPFSQTANTIDEYRDSLLRSLATVTGDHLSPCIDYWVTGEILQQPEVGGYLIMDRWSRNGVLVRGRFSTSKITKITEDGFETMNSVYKLEEIEPEEILG